MTDITLNYGDITEEYVAATWNLPHWIVEQCDTYILHTFTYKELRRSLFGKVVCTAPEDKFFLIDNKEYKAVWHNEALATYLNPQVFPSEPEFLVSFRKIGTIKLALIQRKRK